MDKLKVAVVGTGPAGLVAAFALHNDRQSRYDVTILEAVSILRLHASRFIANYFLQNSGLSLDGHSYDWVNPESGQRTRIDVPMRVFSGRYYQNLFYLLEYLGIPSVERRFLFAFADDVGTISRYYFFHSSNNHRFPRICRRSSGVSGTLAALWTFLQVLCCYIWLSIACFWVPPMVQGREGKKTETMGEYLGRLRLPTFFIEDYLVPLFSSVSSSPHRLFLNFPAVYLTDYKRQTHLFPHRTSVSMTLLQDRLTQGISVTYSAKVTGVKPFEGRLKLSYQDINSGNSETVIFDRVILAVNPKQTSAIYPPTSYVMDKLQTSDVRVVVHRDYNCLPEQSSELVHDSRSELIAMQIKLDSTGGKTTVATHAHPSGVLVTVWPGNQDLVSIDRSKILHESKFVRLLSDTTSRNSLAGLFRERFNKSKESPWLNGEDGVYVAGGWAWDGFALLEGCVWSGLQTARSIGAELPFTPVERRWR